MATRSGKPAPSRRPAQLQLLLIVLGALVLLGTVAGILLPQERKWLAGVSVAVLVFLNLIVTWWKSSPERSDGFTTVFDEATREDSDVWQILDGRRPSAFIEDVERWAHERGDRPDARAYGTFITARVEAGGIPFGLLTVNALRPGSLVKEDRLYVEAIARILAIAELLCLTTQTYQKIVDATARRAALSDAGHRLHVTDQGGA